MPDIRFILSGSCQPFLVQLFDNASCSVVQQMSVDNSIGDLTKIFGGLNPNTSYKLNVYDKIGNTIPSGSSTIITCNNAATPTLGVRCVNMTGTATQPAPYICLMKNIISIVPPLSVGEMINIGFDLTTNSSSGMANSASVECAAANDPLNWVTNKLSYNGQGNGSIVVPICYGDTLCYNISTTCISGTQSSFSGCSVVNLVCASSSTVIPNLLQVPPIKLYVNSSYIAPILASLITNPVSIITTNGANSGGNISSDGGSTITTRGIVWATTPNPTIANNQSTNGGGTGLYSASLNNLAPSTSYHVRSFATNGVGTSYGNDVTFTTLALPTYNLNYTFNSGGVGDLFVIKRNGLVVISTQSSVNSSITGLYSTDTIEIIQTIDCTSNVVNSYLQYTMNGNTVKDDRSCPNNQSYLSITNLSTDITVIGSTTSNPAVAPTVVTNAATGILTTSATGNGNVSNDGGSPVTTRGIVWATFNNPTIADGISTGGNGTGSFTAPITGLIPSTNYHIRAFATNSIATVYGSDTTFMTAAVPPVAPTVSTTFYTNITTYSVDAGGNITSDGGAAITARGLVWNTSPNPTIANNKSNSGVGTGVYASTAAPLSPSTTYYIKAYATNAVGTAYGSEFVATTMALSVPSVTTTSVSNILGISATSGGDITNDGGALVTAYGVVWSTNPNPTLANSYTTDSGGLQYTSYLNGLTQNTLYYVRAYATNSVGTAYGNQVSFTTLNTMPITIYIGPSVNLCSVSSGNYCYCAHLCASPALTSGQSFRLCFTDTALSDTTSTSSGLPKSISACAFAFNGSSNTSIASSSVGSNTVNSSSISKYGYVDVNNSNINSIVFYSVATSHPSNATFSFSNCSSVGLNLVTNTAGGIFSVDTGILSAKSTNASGGGGGGGGGVPV